MVDYIHGRARAATVFGLTLAWIWFPLRSLRSLRVLGGKGFLTAEFAGNCRRGRQEIPRNKQADKIDLSR
jgi:hypothetical protein